MRSSKQRRKLSEPRRQLKPADSALWKAREATKGLLMNLLAPRPLVWITSIGRLPLDEVVLAPFSAIIPVCNHPPMLIFSAQRRSDGARKATARNIIATGEFVVNVIDDDQVESAVKASSPNVPVSLRFSTAGVHQARSFVVKPDRVAECKGNLECRVRNYQEIGQSPYQADLFLAEVVHICHRPGRKKFKLSSGAFEGVGALDVEWYLTSTGLRKIPG